MKKLVSLFAILTIITFFNLVMKAETLMPSNTKYSILGSDRDIIFSSIDSSTTATTQKQEKTEYSVDVPTKTAQGIAGGDLLDYMYGKNAFCYTKEGWQDMKKCRDKGVPPGTELDISTQTVSIKPSLPPGLAVELPYESQLSITGRKLIGASLKATIYDQPEAEKRVNSTSFSMEQELQVKIKGTVGRKIHVNVDFDDTKNDKRDISVVYKGDPDEFVQEAAFGDINMSLPSTEFVGYSKQLFGIKMDTKYKNLRTKAFFSRTKGLSEVKRFTGNTQLVRKTISDTSYIRLKYYYLNSGVDNIKIGSIKVYRDDMISNNNASVAITSSTLLEAMNSSTTTYNGNFDLLVPGQDYIADYSAGVITFRNTLGSNYMIAIDYQKNDGTWIRDTGAIPGTPKVIKDANNTRGITTELQNVYNLGNVKIIRDNGRDNFILQVRDLNDSVPSSINPGGKPVPQYPSQPSNSVNMNVDFDNGIVYFSPINSEPFGDDLYTVNSHRYNLFTEYRYRIKIITLRPDIIPESERVTLDGKLLTRDKDYFIDYDIGILTLYDEEMIKEDTVIDISYDYAPFGNTGSSTLIGIRSELAVTENVFVGSSFIYDYASRGLSTPDIRSTPSSLMVGEVDSSIKNIDVPGIPLKMSISGEYAMSKKNPNTMDKAIVESMEGIEQTDSASLIDESWLPSASPAASPFYYADISWNDVEVYKRDISSELEIERDEKQLILGINYNLTRANQVSLIQKISTSGMDYSKKLYLKMWINGDGKGEQLSIEYGSFNENADGKGILRTEDKNSNGTLDSGEDIGWSFENPDGSVTIVGAGNGILDSMDLNENAILDTADIPALPSPYGPADGRTVVDSDGVGHTTIDWTGWKLFHIPLEITNPDDWKYIKQVRLTVKGAGQTGTIHIGELAVVGNRWEAIGSSVAGSTITLSVVNNEDSDYVSLANNYAYQQLYDIQDTSYDIIRQEQALSLKYDVVLASSVEMGAKLVFSGTAYDLSGYEYLKFFVYPNGAIGDTLYIQAAGDDSNYHEYSIPITADWNKSWKLITIKQQGRAGYADHWVLQDNEGSISITGSPSLKNISQIKVGIRTTGPTSGEVWVNDIFVTDSFKKDGQARKIDMGFVLPATEKVGEVKFGGGRKEVERNFETFTPGTYDRDLLSDNGYFSFGGFKAGGINYLPVNLSMSRNRTITPSVVQNQDDLVSILEEGKVITYSASGNTSLKFGKYSPGFTGSYGRSISDSQEIERLEDKETVSGSMDYVNPLKIAVLPKSIYGNYSISNSFYRVYPLSKVVDSDSFLDISAANDYLSIKDFHTLEISETWSVKTPFSFWKVWDFIPNYSLNTVNEKNKDFDVERRYPKSLNQNVGANSSFYITRWLQPKLNYSITTKENYNLTYSTSGAVPTYPSQTKYIERNSNGEISWSLQFKDLVRNKYLQSLGFQSAFKIQDTDSYDNMDKDFDPLGAAFDKLWIRDNSFEDLSSGTTSAYNVKSIVTRDNTRVSGRYNPLEAFNIKGRAAALKTMTMNFTYTGNDEHSYLTGTQKDIYTRIWPDLLFGLGQFEKLIYLDKWLDDSHLNLRHNRKTVDTLDISFSESKTYGGDWRLMLTKKYDINLAMNTTTSEDFDLIQKKRTSDGESLEWSTQGGATFGKWRCVLRYTNNEDWKKDANGELTSQKLKNTYTGTVKADMSFPRGLPIPFSKRKLALTNRIIYNGNLSYSTQRSILNIEQDNVDRYSIGSSADYEISQNFRLSVGLSWGRTVYIDNPKENYSTIELSSRLNIQF
ncbi:hypothetical protein ACFL58_03025 [Elusimicrobiota bacterium]